MIGREIETKVVCTATMEFILQKLALKQKIADRTTFDGIDRFYGRDDDPTMNKVFARYRTSNGKDELTVKRRNHAGNILDRLEVNIPIISGELPTESIDLFFATLGFTYRLSLAKAGYFFMFPSVVISVYTVNRDKYLEVEVLEGFSEDLKKCKAELENYEQILGITPRMRVNASLPEIYRAV